MTKEMKERYERIDRKYQDPTTSGLTCTIVKDVPAQVEFVLEAAKDR